jgi:hypothetical protein
MSRVRAALDDALEKSEVLIDLQEAVDRRLAYCNELQQLQIEALSNRALHPQCRFDREHRLMLYALALAPDQVSWTFKLRERLHRVSWTSKRWLVGAVGT